MEKNKEKRTDTEFSLDSQPEITKWGKKTKYKKTSIVSNFKILNVKKPQKMNYSQTKQSTMRKPYPLHI